MGDMSMFWKVAEPDAMRKAIMLQDLNFQLAMVRALREERGIPAPTPKPQEVIRPRKSRAKTLPKRDIIYLDQPVSAPAEAYKRILREVAMKHGITVNTLIGQDRFYHIVQARHEAVYRLRTETKMSYPAIGRRMGNRDHTTCLSSYRAYVRQMKEEVEESKNEMGQVLQ